MGLLKTESRNEPKGTGADAEPGEHHHGRRRGLALYGAPLERNGLDLGRQFLRRESTSVPRRVPGLNYIKFIASGEHFCLAVKTDGTLWAWGGNYEGQLGDGTKVDRYSPVQVPNLTNMTAAAGGYGHSLALKADGTVWAWGKNFDGQVSNGTKDTRLSPVKIQHLIKVVAVAAGERHSVALKDDGTVWGGDDYKVPTKIESLKLRQ